MSPPPEKVSGVQLEEIRGRKKQSAAGCSPPAQLTPVSFFASRLPHSDKELVNYRCQVRAQETNARKQEVTLHTTCFGAVLFLKPLVSASAIAIALHCDVSDLALRSVLQPALSRARTLTIMAGVAKEINS